MLEFSAVGAVPGYVVYVALFALLMTDEVMSSRCVLLTNTSMSTRMSTPDLLDGSAILYFCVVFLMS